MLLKLPMADKGVIGSLIESIKRGTSVHAYLFEGEKGLKKREMASYFAMALLCQDDDVPCGRCESCLQAMSGNNPDIIRLALSDITTKKSVGADDIRSIISDVYTRPFKAQKKIYIIEDGDALTVQAQNAMLKVLEEPPPYAVFIICATNAELILPTVRSRSRSVHFAPIADEKIISYVKEKYPHMADRADFVASFSAGILGRADFICSDESVMDMRAKSFDFLKALLIANDEENIFKMCEAFEEYKKDKNVPFDTSQMMLDFMLSFLSDLLHIIGGAKKICANSDILQELVSLSSKVSYDRVFNAMQSVLDTKQMLLRYVNHKASIMKFALDVFYAEQ